jgi:hypothetical protein
MIEGRYDEHAEDGVFQAGHYGWFFWLNHKTSRCYPTEQEAQEAFERAKRASA